MHLYKCNDFTGIISQKTMDLRSVSNKGDLYTILQNSVIRFIVNYISIHHQRTSKLCLIPLFWKFLSCTFLYLSEGRDNIALTKLVWGND